MSNTIYLNIDGIKGNVSDQHHKDWIVANSANFTISKEIYTQRGSSEDYRKSSKPYASEVELIKPLDPSSTQLAQMAYIDKSIDTVKIDYCQTEGQPYLEVTLNDVVVCYYELLGANGDERPMEQIRLHFATFEYRYTPYDKANHSGAPSAFKYDLTTNAMC